MPGTCRGVKRALPCAIVEQTKTPERADPITRLLARRVAELRKASGMSQADLGERMAQLRSGWTRSTVAKLEKNLRESVSVGDLLALAQALDVPPVMLVADPRHVAEVPVADGAAVPAWEALMWLTGAKDLAGRRDSPTFTDGAWYADQAMALGAALHQLEHESRVTGTRDEQGNLTRDPETVRRVVEERERLALERVRAVLERIERFGEHLPALPPAVVKRAAELGVDLPGQAS